MSFWDRITGKDLKEVQKELKALQEARLEIDDTNQMYQAIYNFIQGRNLNNGDLENSVKYGYNRNVSCFGIVNILSTIFSEPEDRLYFYKGDEKTEVDPKDFGIEFLEKPNHYQSWTEFKKHWAASFYITGNSQVYAPIEEVGVDQKKLLKNQQLYVMPSQNVEIFAKSWRDPISEYGFTINDRQTKIPAQHIWHERFAPNLDFSQGENFYGKSPVLVALNLILAQIEGYEFISNTYAKRMPPGILFADSEYKEGITEKERDKFKETFKKSYQGKRSDGLPMYASKGHYEKIGFDSMRDLQVLDTLADGQRQLSTAIGVPSQIFNDIAGTTFSNQEQALKRLYFLRTKPDWRTFYDGLNSERIRYYNENLCLEPDITNIEALKANQEILAKIYHLGVKIGAFSKNEFRRSGLSFFT